MESVWRTANHEPRDTTQHTANTPSSPACSRPPPNRDASAFPGRLATAWYCSIPLFDLVLGNTTASEADKDPCVAVIISRLSITMSVGLFATLAASSDLDSGTVRSLHIPSKPGSIAQFVARRRSCFNGSSSSYSAWSEEETRLHDIPIPDLQLELASASASLRNPRVAVCIAGLVRTLEHPMVWTSLKQYVTMGGSTSELATVAVLERAGASIQGWSDEQSDTCALDAALVGLHVRRVKWVNSTTTPAPCNRVWPLAANLNQVVKWAHCVPLVRSLEEHEAMQAATRAQGQAYEYDSIFIVRPDIVWNAPLDLRHAAQHIAPIAVLSCLDYRSLWPRRTWAALEAFALARCPERCGGPIPNEFCFRLAHLAEHHVIHLEAHSPPNPEGCRRSADFIRHIHPVAATAIRFATSPWTAAFCMGGEIGRWLHDVKPEWASNCSAASCPIHRWRNGGHGCPCVGVPPLDSLEQRAVTSAGCRMRRSWIPQP